MKKFIVAVIGVGHWGKNILRVVSELESCELSLVVYSGSSETSSYLEKNYPDTPTSVDINCACRKPEIEYIFIATPIETHYEIAKKFLMAGKNVFVEKPLSINVHEVEELYMLAQERNLYLVTGYIYLFDEGVTALKSIIKKSDACRISLTWEKWGGFCSPVDINLLVHEIALSIVLAGEQKKIISLEVGEDRVCYEAIHKRSWVTITINRKIKDNRKIISAIIDKSLYVLENGTLLQVLKDESRIVVANSMASLLKKECEAFLQKHEIFKRKEMDMAIAETFRYRSQALTSEYILNGKSS